MTATSCFDYDFGFELDHEVPDYISDSIFDGSPFESNQNSVPNSLMSIASASTNSTSAVLVDHMLVNDSSSSSSAVIDMSLMETLVNCTSLQQAYNRCLSTEMSFYGDETLTLADLKLAFLMQTGIKQEFASSTVPALDDEMSPTYERQRSLLHSLSVDLPHLDEFLQLDSMEKWRQRVEQTAVSLDINLDPYRWNESSMRTWLRFVCGLNNISDDFVDSVCGDGLSLCTTNADRMQLIFGSETAKYIQNELDIWKCVFKFTHGLPSTPLWPDEHAVYPATVVIQPQAPVEHLQQHTVEAAVSFTSPHSITTLTSSSHLPASASPCRPQFLPSCLSLAESTFNLTAGCDINSPTSSTSSGFNTPLSGTWSIDSFGSTVDTRDLNTSVSSIMGNEVSSLTSEEFVSRPAPKKSRTGPGKHTVHLWQFLRELLMQPDIYRDCIRWMDQSKGIFKIEDSSRVAKLWGQRKNRPAMNYDKLSRSIRQYYKKQIIHKTGQSKRLVYQFYPQFI